MTVALEQPHPQHLKKWTREEYLELVERGAFRGQHIYLFRGDIIQMAPHGHPHAFGIMRLSRYLMSTFPEPFEVRVQLSFIAPGQSVPEPDLAVCEQADAVRKPHPAQAVLIVEVAYSSLDDDRALAEEYAGARVPEYWIVDVDRRCVEVYRNPVEDKTARYGYRYSEMHLLRVGEVISPMTRPENSIPVATFFA